MNICVSASKALSLVSRPTGPVSILIPQVLIIKAPVCFDLVPPLLLHSMTANYL